MNEQLNHNDYKDTWFFSFWMVYQIDTWRWVWKRVYPNCVWMLAKKEGYSFCWTYKCGTLKKKKKKSYLKFFPTSMLLMMDEWINYDLSICHYLKYWVTWGITIEPTFAGCANIVYRTLVLNPSQSAWTQEDSNGPQSACCFWRGFSNVTWKCLLRKMIFCLFKPKDFLWFSFSKQEQRGEDPFAAVFHKVEPTMKTAAVKNEILPSYFPQKTKLLLRGLCVYIKMHICIQYLAIISSDWKWRPKAGYLIPIFYWFYFQQKGYFIFWNSPFGLHWSPKNQKAILFSTFSYFTLL